MSITANSDFMFCWYCFTYQILIQSWKSFMNQALAISWWKSYIFGSQNFVKQLNLISCALQQKEFFLLHYLLDITLIFDNFEQRVTLINNCWHWIKIKYYFDLSIDLARNVSELKPNDCDLDLDLDTIVRDEFIHFIMILQSHWCIFHALWWKKMLMLTFSLLI